MDVIDGYLNDRLAEIIHLHSTDESLSKAAIQIIEAASKGFFDALKYDIKEGFSEFLKHRPPFEEAHRVFQQMHEMITRASVEDFIANCKDDGKPESTTLAYRLGRQSSEIGNLVTFDIEDMFRMAIVRALEAIETPSEAHFLLMQAAQLVVMGRSVRSFCAVFTYGEEMYEQSTVKQRAIISSLVDVIETCDTEDILTRYLLKHIDSTHDYLAHGICDLVNTCMRKRKYTDIPPLYKQHWDGYGLNASHKWVGQRLKDGH